MYEWPELIRLWEHEQVTEVQVIGQLLKYGEAQHTQIMTLQRRLEQVEHTVSILRTGTPPHPAPSDKSSPSRR